MATPLHYPPTRNVPFDLECEMNYTGGSYGVHRSGYQIKKVEMADGQVFTFGHNLERLNSILGIRYSSQRFPGLRDRS
ncbi:MAG: hypothetical protein KDC71_22655, partial [Acidobacteria bacterium]|nr:hypothetical protein [Acidobacteriota bacterium]